MAISLRTRLFLMLAVVLAASIALSSVLSRRAALVEVTETVRRTTAGPRMPGAARELGAFVREREVRRGNPLARAWIVMTTMVAGLAIALTFVVSRRVLRPVGALTDAVRRMERGERDVHVPSSAHDGDELGDLARAFNAMAARLAEPERLRRQMVSDVAHELRSPVTNLRCTLEAMQDGLVSADRAGIDALHDETLLLQRLITDLQDLALADAGRLELSRVPTDLADVIRRAASTSQQPQHVQESVEPQEPTDAPSPAGSRAARLTLDLPSNLPPVMADPDRLVQVFRNLLENARRHTPADGSIVVCASADGSRPRRCRVEVRDTGRGIPAEHLPYVFDRFYRVDGSRSRATGGAGLGLAIVRQLVLAHDGTIEVTSPGNGLGTTVVVTLPIAGARVAS